jgi:hypothetical protein
MSHLTPSFRVRVIAWAFAPAFAVVGCGGGYVAVDGYDYDVNGRFYHQHSGRWVAYRSAPPEVLRARAEGRGRVERR